MASTVRHQEKFGSDHGLIHEAVVTGRKVGAGKDFWEKMAHDEAAFRRALSAVSAGPVRPEVAARIMGGNFLSTFAASQFLSGGRFPDADDPVMKTVPFSAEFLSVCRDTHILVAAPPLSLLDIHRKAKELFGDKGKPWFASENFAKTKMEMGWYLVGQEPVLGSVSSTWEEQKALLSEEEIVPTTALLAYVAVAWFRQFGRRFPEHIYVRTSDITSDGKHVGFGGGVAVGGLDVDGYSDTVCDPRLGLLVVRKSG